MCFAVLRIPICLTPRVLFPTCILQLGNTNINFLSLIRPNSFLLHLLALATISSLQTPLHLPHPHRRRLPDRMTILMHRQYTLLAPGIRSPALCMRGRLANMVHRVFDVAAAAGKDAPLPHFRKLVLV